MTGSFDSLVKAHSSTGAGTPKLERLNAKKNAQYIPQSEGSATLSSPAHTSRIGAPESGDILTSFRLLGNNLEEEIENICRSTGISKQEFVGGISQESWQSVSKQRKFRSGPLLSDQITSSMDSMVHHGQPARGTSYISNSQFSLQNQLSEPTVGNFYREASDSTVAGDMSYFKGRVNRVSAGGSNTATSGPAFVASCGNSEASYHDKQDTFLDSAFYVHHKATATSDSSQYIYRPSVQVQAISELSMFVDNERVSYPLTNCDVATASSPVTFADKDLLNPAVVGRIEENLQSQKFEYDSFPDGFSRPSLANSRTLPDVLEDSVSPTPEICLKQLEACSTSQIGCPEIVRYSRGQEDIDLVKFCLTTKSNSSDAVLNSSANKGGVHDELLSVGSVFPERRIEDSAHEHLPLAATLDRELMNMQTVTSAAEEQSTFLNMELSQSAQSISHLQLYHRQTLLKVPSRTPWSFWRKGDFLGSGSFGMVYEGVNSEGLFFAVKEVSLGDKGREAEQSILQLEQEIEILSQFQHENIVQYLGTQREERKLYIFLEFMTKGALSTLYKKLPLFDSQMRSYTRQILCGLRYLHKMGIVHRDIKCANILVHANGTVKLADFGMARVLKQSEQLKSCKGSAYWMAPEVIIPKKTYSFPADIWSLGCTVLEMATGNPPFGYLEWNTVLWKVGHGEVPPIPDRLHDDAKDFIRQCLQVDPAMRPTADVLSEHPFIKSKNWHATSIHSSMHPILVATTDSLANEDLDNLDGASPSQGTSSYSSSDSSAFGDDEPKRTVSGSKFSARSVRTRRSPRLLQ